MFGISSQTLLKSNNTRGNYTYLNKKLTKLLEKASHGRYGSKQAKTVQKVAIQSIGITLGIDAFKLSLEILLTQISHLEA